MKYLDKYVKPGSITHQGAVGAGGICSGAALMLMGSLTGTYGAVAGALLVLTGVIISHHKPMAGVVTVGTGLAVALPLIMPSLKPIVGDALNVGSWGLLGFGAWNILRFMQRRTKNLKPDEEREER